MALITIVEILFFTYFVLHGIYIAFFSTAGYFYTEKALDKKLPANKIAVLIPAYKEDNVIVSVAKEALNQDYPNNFFDVVVIADSLKPDTLIKLQQLPVKTIQVEFKNSTKVKSLNKALELLDNKYEIALILDADNIMDYSFLKKINLYYSNGYKVIQGRRTAKNLNTNFAILDSISESINNHIFRKGFNAAGLSSAIIGSGMAFEYSLIKNILQKSDAIGGFDRELQLKVVENGYKIKYVHSAIVYDEKVQKATVYKNQRRRWLSSQYYYLFKFFPEGFKNLFRSNFDYFKFAVLTNLFLPQLISLGTLVLLTLLSLIFNQYLTIPFIYWLIISGLFLYALGIAIPAKHINLRSLKALLQLPYMFILMVISMMKIKGANKKFIHTPHTDINFENEKAV